MECGRLTLPNLPLEDYEIFPGKTPSYFRLTQTVQPQSWKKLVEMVSPTLAPSAAGGSGGSRRNALRSGEDRPQTKNRPHLENGRKHADIIEPINRKPIRMSRFISRVKIHENSM